MKNHIPTHPLSTERNMGISIEKISIDKSSDFNAVAAAHRHDFHFFVMLQKGSGAFEVDFKRWTVCDQMLFHIHPQEVHRILHAAKATFTVLAIETDKVNQDYQEILEELTPIEPIALKKADYQLLDRALSTSRAIFDAFDSKVYPQYLRDSCNACIGLMISQFLKQPASAGKSSRYRSIFNSFRGLLAEHYRNKLRPGDYARHLNISVSYLNEIVQHTTSLSASKYIQERTLLEAKRLLLHTDKSVKEIGFYLGFADVAYFSRFFTVNTGLTASGYRIKNHD